MRWPRTNLRYGVQSDGKRYVARDRAESARRDERCEHAVWNGRTHKVIWLPHAEGGIMQPFEGPDEVYAELCKEGSKLWGRVRRAVGEGAAVTEADLRANLEVWKRRLGLEHWLILLEMGGADDETSYMEVERSTVYQHAVIHVQPWLLGDGEAPKEVMVRGEHLTDRFIECSLVHELLHCCTRNMRAIVREDLEGQIHRDVHSAVSAAMARAEEQCVDSLAEALVRAWV